MTSNLPRSSIELNAWSRAMVGKKSSGPGLKGRSFVLKNLERGRPVPSFFKRGFAQNLGVRGRDSPPESGGADCEGVSARAVGVVPLANRYMLSGEPPQRALQPAGCRATRPLLTQEGS